MRKMPPGTFGQLKSRIPRVTLEGELGFLTPVRPAALGFHIFRCRCGVEVSKQGKYVKRQVERGACPKCRPQCTGVPAQGEVSHG